MYKPPFINLILKLSEICNLNCSFCYYANNSIDTVNPFMDIGLCKKAIEKAVLYNISNNVSKLDITFHGGEPLLCGIAYLKEIMAFEKSLTQCVKEDFLIQNTIQTNGYLLNDQWISFFKENDIKVGLSIDGSKNLNFHVNVEGVEGLDNEVLNHYNNIKNSGIDCGVISVITNKHKGQASNYYDFCRNNSIDLLGLNYCFNNNMTDYSIDPEIMVNFTKELFDLYFEGTYNFRIREFDCAINNVLQKKCNFCAMNKRSSCGKFLTIDTLGRVFFCDYAYDKERKIGDIRTDSFANIILGQGYQAERERSQIFLRKCQSCTVYDICGGGCYRNDIFIKNECNDNYFCKANKKIYSYISEQVNNVVAIIQGGG